MSPDSATVRSDGSLAYARAGVDITAGDEAVRRIAPHVARTARPEVVGALGGFGAGFAFDPHAYREPILVSATDGVGTKLKVAALAERWDTVGIDLVAMCVNDVVTTGAEPLFFLDYLATGALDPQVAEQVVSGIADGCVQAGCALVGGETAEMPGMYAGGELDLAGFSVGVIERAEQLSSARVRSGDMLIGLASSGLHSNGYSLVRKLLLDEAALDLHDVLPQLGRPLVDELLEPTRIYVRQVRAICERFPVAAAAHITGGGLLDNVPRVLPPGAGAAIRHGSWQVPAIFELLRTLGGLSDEECHGTFNMGIGMVLIVPPAHAQNLLAWLHDDGGVAWLIGEVVEGIDGVRLEEGPA